MILKRITRWILRSAPLYNVLIAILTSAIVTLLAGGNVLTKEINFWLLGGVVIAIIAIICLSYLSGIAQNVSNRAMSLNEQNGQIGEETIEDAFVHVLHLKEKVKKKPCGNNEELLITHEKHLLAWGGLICISLIALIVVFWKGETIQQDKHVMVITEEIKPSLDSIKYNLDTYQLSLDNRLDRLSYEINVMMDTLQVVRNMTTKKQQNTPLSPKKK